MADEKSDKGYVQVEYLGSGTRKILKADFERIGIEDQNVLVWDDSNDFVAGMRPDAAQRLVETHKNEFRIAK